MSQDSNVKQTLTEPEQSARKTALVALGSNVSQAGGTCAHTVRAAIDALAKADGVTLRTASRLWETPCVPAGAGPDYINAVVALETALDAPALLDVLHEIERAFDRARTGRWAARTLDLDLIDHDGQVRPDPETQAFWRALPPERQPIDAPDHLITPHPRLQDRAFVLVPLAEAAPNWRDPVSGDSVTDLIAALPTGDLAAMTPLPDAAISTSEGLSSVTS